ncbi:Ger(x)C family spore germination protein [Cohnella sp.]|uniref:Ger(x)C family spore germination protein n=1 Tax=Cohnella sp. TaxID=1883426 RepID=UPI00356326DC
MLRKGNVKIRRLGLPGLALLGLIFLSGCWDYRELNELSLAMAIGIDKDAKTGDYRVTFQIVNSKEIAGRNATGAVAPVAVFTESGETVFEAVRKVALKGSRRISLQHLRDLVIGERLAREGVKELFDLLERDHESRLTTRVYIARGTDAETLLKTLTPIDEIPANAILGKIQLAESTVGENYEVQLVEAIHGIYRKNAGLAISGIKLTGPETTGRKRANLMHTDPPAALKVAGMAVMKNGKLVGWLNRNETRGVAWINNKLKSTIVNLKCEPKGKIAVETYGSATKLKADVRDDRPVIRIIIKQTGKVGEANCPVDLTKSDEIKKLEQQWEAITVHEVKQAVKLAKRLNSDILGFGEAVQRDRPKAWKAMEKEWGELFRTCKAEVTVETVLLRTGMTTKSSMTNK